jgi:hypothetical protein
VAYRMMVNGITKKRLWILFIAMGAVDAALEIPLCNIPGLYVYYGNEMLMFHRYPTWMFALNGVSMVAVCAMVILVEKNITQWWHWFIIPLLASVMCIGTGYGIIIWPGEYMVNNFQFSPALTTLGGIVTCMLCFTEIWAFSQVLCTDGRFDLLTSKQLKTAGKLDDQRILKDLAGAIGALSNAKERVETPTVGPKWGCKTWCN